VKTGWKTLKASDFKVFSFVIGGNEKTMNL